MTSPSAQTSQFFADLMRTVSERGLKLMRRPRVASERTPQELAQLLISRRGEASGVALAQSLLDSYTRDSLPGRLSFLVFIAEKFGPDIERVRAAAATLVQDIGQKAAMELHDAAEPKRQELFRRLNAAPGATSALVRMREDLLDNMTKSHEFEFVDRDLLHLFSSWFNRGFLVLRPISWTTPAHILSKIIRYEAVHAIKDWDDLRSRLEPADRRCFAFFHPQLGDDPLIFVEVAITDDIPSSIAALLEGGRAPTAPEKATTAVFYSISNTQRGLAGVSFGNFLIKQVVDDLSRDLPNVKRFVTLSPVVGFAKWLAAVRAGKVASSLRPDQLRRLTPIDEAGWHLDPKKVSMVREELTIAAAHYSLMGKDEKGRPLDPVARFHLGNGARLERINFLGDCSEKGLQQSHGIMVNYLYEPDQIERNHEEFSSSGTIAASPNLTYLTSSNGALPFA